MKRPAMYTAVNGEAMEHAKAARDQAAGRGDAWEDERGRQLLELARLGQELHDLAAHPGANPNDLRGLALTRLQIMSQSEHDRFVFEPINIHQLIARAKPPEWAIKRVLVMGQSAILGGPKKALKTSIAVDMAVSLTTGTRFLGAFDVPRKRRVCLVSGESGDFIVLDIVRRGCAARGLHVDDVLENLAFHFRLPQLSNRAQLREMARGLKECGAEHEILDPLYLCLLAGVAEGGPQASNMLQMGPLYSDVAEICLGVGCMPILAHHFRTTRDALAQPELSDLAFAGVQEFAAQWLLVGRRDAYQPGSGKHLLHLVAGGRAGHSGAWGVDINEGELGDDFSGRKWDVQVLSESDAITGNEDRRRSMAAEKKRRQEVADEADFLRMLDKQDPERAGVTQNRLLEAKCLSAARTKAAIVRLLQKGIIKKTRRMVRVGSGASVECDLCSRA